MSIDLYTDGSGLASGPAGWAFVALQTYDNARHHIELARRSGRILDATSNVAEMTAVWVGLKWCHLNYPEATINVFSDSQYVTNAFNEGWMEAWIAKDWRNYRGRPVANKEIWQNIQGLTEILDVRFWHIPAHAGIWANEECDVMAGRARKENHCV